MSAMAAEAEEVAADLAIALQRKAALDAGKHADLPAEVSAALLAGASYLSALRKRRGLTPDATGPTRRRFPSFSERPRKPAVC